MPIVSRNNEAVLRQRSWWRTSRSENADDGGQGAEGSRMPNLTGRLAGERVTSGAREKEGEGTEIPGGGVSPGVGFVHLG